MKKSEKIQCFEMINEQIGLYHLLDGITNLKYKLLCSLTTKKFLKEKKALAFYRDRCSHLALCLRLILFHFFLIISISLNIKKLLNSSTNLHGIVYVFTSNNNSVFFHQVSLTTMQGQEATSPGVHSINILHLLLTAISK